MAIVLMDSFDNYTTLSGKRWTTGHAAITASGRNGSAAYCSGNKSGGYNGLLQNDFSSLSEIIIVGAINSNGLEYWDWRLQDGTTVHIHMHLSGGVLVVRRGLNGTILGTGTTALNNNTWYHIQLRVKIHDTTGTVKLAVNGVTEFSITGLDTKNGSSSVVNRFTHNINGGPYYGEPTFTAYLDDFVIMDTTGSANNDFIGDCKIECLQPNGNGNSSVLVGSDSNSTDNYLLVDEIPPDDDTSYVESSTASDKDTYAFEDLTTVSGDVLGLQICTWAKKTEAPAHTFASVARLSGTEEDTASDFALTTSYAYYLDRRETKPGGGAWTISDVNSAEFGIKVKS